MTDIIANLLGKTVIDKKMRILKRKLERLNRCKDDMFARLREEEHHPGKRRKNVVKNWLNEVESMQKEFESLEAQVNQNSRISRLALAKSADEMIGEVTELLDQGIFSEGVVLDVTAEWKGQAFEENFQRVWTFLLGNEVSSIGVYGMGGVGKTTLAQCIFNELKKEDTFIGDVFWFTVSRDFNIHKLQNDIGKSLNLDLSSETDEHKRAAKLGWAFLRKKRFVLMLDDVWTPFSLQEIGISPSLATYGFKIIVISRSMEVCRKMKCQKYLRVEVLSEEDAWKLFMNKLSNGVRLPPKVEEIAREVAKKCAGLPLAIIAVAGSLRGVMDILEWRDALEELKISCMGQDVMENEVFPVLLYSFNRLRDPVLKRCFLYCSLYPEDFHIERRELITHFILEQLMERRITRQAYFGQGHRILNKLENVCLLERYEEYGEETCVKMHNLIRDMALKITKDNCMVKAGLQLEEIPEEQQWKEDWVKISLMDNNIERIRSITLPECPKLSTLLLNHNPLKSIPDSFFLQMRGLHVLNLSYTQIKYLPSSTSDLEELNALLLRSCEELVFVPPLGNLKALKELDLSNSGIKEMPKGVESLTNLECLDTVGSHIETFPKGILQGLSLLQRLSLPKQMTIPIEEVAVLKRLEEIEGKFCNMHDFNIFMKARPSGWKLSSCYIEVGDRSSPIFINSERLGPKLITFGKDSLNKGKRGKNEIMLPRDIEYLRFDQSGLSSCDDFQQLNNLTELKECHIYNEEGIECILRLSLVKELMAEKELSSLFPLHYVESLNLHHLQNFIGLIMCDVATAVSPLPPGLFSHLQTLEVRMCGKIKQLLPRSLVQNVPNLKKLTVDSCAQMEEIIGDDEIDGGLGAESNTVFNLPGLEFLELIDLPELKSICKGTLICDSIEYIRIRGITKVRKVPLSLPLLNPLLNGQPSPHPSLKNISLSEEEKGWWESLDWDHPNAKSVLKPFVEYATPMLRMQQLLLINYQSLLMRSQLDCKHK